MNVLLQLLAIIIGATRLIIVPQLEHMAIIKVYKEKVLLAIGSVIIIMISIGNRTHLS